MPQFKISSAEMYQAAQDEAAVARNLGRIEGEIQSILNTLSMNSASATRIKQSLRSEIQSVSNVRQKLWVLSSALEEITKIYESAEKNVIGKNLDEMKNGRLSEKAVRLSNELRELGRTLGVERSGTYSGDPVNMCNGNYIYEKALFNLNTPMQMRFRIFYNIQNQNVGIFGRGWTHTYDIQLHFENDRISMCRDDASQMVFMRAKDGGWESLHGTFGVLKEDEQQGYSVTDRYECTYVFDRGGRLLREIDAMGNSFCLVYDTNGRLEKAEDKYGNFLSFHYNLAGEIDQLSDHTGRTAEFIYINGHLSSVKDAQGRITKYNYDSNGWLTGLENARGTELLKNGYDQQGRTLKQVFPDGGEIRYSYLDSRNQVEMTEQNGNTVIYEHDALYRNVRNIYQDGEEHFTYNDDNLRTSFTDKRGNTSYFAYNDQGNMTEFRNPLGDRVQLEYTQHGQIKTAVLNGIVMYQASYNENNRQESVENALGAKEYFEYDEYGYPSVWIRADGSRILMEQNCI